MEPSSTRRSSPQGQGFQIRSSSGPLGPVSRVCNIISKKNLYLKGSSSSILWFWGVSWITVINNSKHLVPQVGVFISHDTTCGSHSLSPNSGYHAWCQDKGEMFCRCLLKPFDLWYKVIQMFPLFIFCWDDLFIISSKVVESPTVTVPGYSDFIM